MAVRLFSVKSSGWDEIALQVQEKLKDLKSELRSIEMQFKGLAIHENGTYTASPHLLLEYDYIISETRLILISQKFQFLSGILIAHNENDLSEIFLDNLLKKYPEATQGVFSKVKKIVGEIRKLLLDSSEMKVMPVQHDGGSIAQPLSQPFLK